MTRLSASIASASSFIAIALVVWRIDLMYGLAWSVRQDSDRSCAAAPYILVIVALAFAGGAFAMYARTKDDDDSEAAAMPLHYFETNDPVGRREAPDGLSHARKDPPSSAERG